jgi:membrane-associated protease RseP (regulator of RpoE activity)
VELRQPERTWRGVALLQGVVARWGKTEAADRARKLLDEIGADPKRAELLAEQGGGEERHLLTAQAQALEHFGELRGALRAWDLLAREHPRTPEGRRAATEAKRLATTPYLGLTFEDDTATIRGVLPKGPADRAGLRTGDVVVQLGEVRITSAAELRRALQGHKAGEKVSLQVQRDGKSVPLTVELGSLPPADEER